jgi:transcription elongation GreA/GreB family factor
MLQIEQKNINGQLNVALEKKVALQKINPALSANKVINGSVIKTNRGYLFVSVALGKAIIDEIAVTSLSPQSPLGVKLLGLLVGDTAEINSTRYVIETIE